MAENLGVMTAEVERPRWESCPASRCTIPANVTLLAGSRLGPYEILAPLGAGGMGEVYRATDTRLSRAVAIKVLPAHLSANAELRERLDREARAISSLSHAHICTLYDVGHQDGIDYLVMEYLEGETLAARLSKGPLPAHEVLRYGVEIAEALDKAHRSGIVHRDVKPGNVMLTKAGAKLLDFGLAKLRGADTRPVVSSVLTSLATEERPLTAEGSIVGTFQYMAPEQLEGKEPDARTDIFAFGAVLYEMATGRKAFAGKSQASLIAAILASEPPPISTIQPMTPPALDRVVRTCLTKDPEERWQNAHDLVNELKWIGEAGSQAGLPAPVVARRKSRERVAWVLAAAGFAAAVAATAAWLLARGAVAPSPPLTRFTVALPPHPRLLEPSVAVSPDGTRVVYVAGMPGASLLYVRPIGELQAVPLSGTDGASVPFFSPDGQWVGFFAQGKLKKVPVEGGTPTTLCDAVTARGASWAPDDTIIFAPSPVTGLFRVPAAGGAPQPLTTTDAGKGERSHRWPHVLPGGKAVLFSVEKASSRILEDVHIEVLLLETNERRVVAEGGAFPRYAPTGHLIFARTGVLLAAPFDASRLTVTGPAAPVLEGVVTPPGNRSAQYAVSATGTLVYLGGSAAATSGSLVWVDRQGKFQPTALPPRGFDTPRLSPDGGRVAMTISEAGGRTDIWVADLSRGTLSRLTFSGGDIETPTWAPDGKRFAFASEPVGGAGPARDPRGQGTQERTIFWKPADGSGSEEPLLRGEHHVHVNSFSADGRALAFSDFGAAATVGDIGILSLEGKPEARLFLQTPFNERAARFSPDGRWLAYTSNESGRDDVYVQPYPGPGGKWQVSTDGGGEPVWARNGREIFYRSGDKMMAVATVTTPTFSAGAPRLLFEAPYASSNSARGDAVYDVAPDGRFLMIKADETRETTSELTVVLNWFAELTRRVPGAKGR